MNRKRLLSVTASAVATIVTASPGAAHAGAGIGAQVCAIGTAGVGQQGTLICNDVLTGTNTQSINLSATVAAAGGIAGSLARHDDLVLVTNQAGGATLLRESSGWLMSPVTLQTGGEGSLSGALSERGAYVLTGTRLLFFPAGQTVASSSQSLLKGDGSAAQVALAGGYAYVSEKNGSLEAFPLADDGNIASAATLVAGIPAGVIVGITGVDELVVAPIAHLATNPNQSAISVAYGLSLVQLVQTKEVAACWAAHGDREVCISNPGSMTVSCGHVSPGGFLSYTGAAASPTGESVFDLDFRKGLVGILATNAGSPVMLIYSRAEDNSDFLAPLSQFPLGAASATGALLLPPVSK